MKNHTPAYTPIEKLGGVFLKRDDTYRLAGVCGGKVRAAYHLATAGVAACDGLITGTARASAQAQIVARLAWGLNVPCRCHMPQGTDTPEMADMRKHGAQIIQHKAGYSTVIQARALEDAKAHPTWRYIPFGLASAAAVGCTRNQVHNIPKEVKRVVVPLGGGISASGILHGLRDNKLGHIPVLGVRVGGCPVKRLDSFAPFGWCGQMEILDVTDRIPYTTPVTGSIGGITLDAYYEAKCLEYLRPGDLFWIVGKRTEG